MNKMSPNQKELLPWQATYSKLYFPKVYWPDFDKTQLEITILEFQNRQRRLGK